MTNVQLNSIVKEYGNVIAVNNISQQINDGEFVTLVGPSGCGKSTTLETIAGLTLPTEGSIIIGDRDVTTAPPKDRNIAMVFQNIALFPHMDVYDNVSYGLRLRDIEKSEIDSRVANALEIVQMSGMQDRMPDEMSGGQRQRIAIARAIVRDPDVFLMDEPLANLDAQLRVHMRTELQRLHRRLDTTIIYVTHDQEEAMTMSDRVIVMNNGQIQQASPPLVCYNEPENLFVAGFIGSPGMNFIPGIADRQRLQADPFNIAAGTTQDIISDGDDVLIGVRPEDVHLADHADSLDAASQAALLKTDVLEPMGDEIIVYLKLPEQNTNTSDSDSEKHAQAPESISDANNLLMKADPDIQIEEEEEVSVVLDREKIHLFDPETGDALQHGIEQPSLSSDIGS